MKMFTLHEYLLKEMHSEQAFDAGGRTFTVPFMTSFRHFGNTNTNIRNLTIRVH